MNHEVKEKWITALRSGEYKQYRGQLRDHLDDSYCCLGVLCDLYIKETGEGRWNKSNFIIDGVTCDVRTGFPPDKVIEWAGLNDRNPIVQYDNKCKPIANFNDSGYSFKEIAQIIEKRL